MKINFESMQEYNVQNKSGAEKPYASMQDMTKKAEKVGAYSVNIGGQNERAQKGGTYKKEDMTAKELSMQASQMDMDVQKMYMAVMSNSMSQEEFQKMVENGVNVSDTDIETMVTILDQIKVAVAKGGGEIAGFTDSLSKETLEQILGSAAYAETIKGGLEEGAIAYMVEQQMPPTAENLYKAKYSAGAYQGKKDLEAPDMESAEGKAFWEQIDKVIEEAGLSQNEESRKDAAFLLKHDIPVTEENLRLYEKVKDFGKGELKLAEEELKYRIAMQAYEGKAASQADLSREKSIYEQAVGIYEAVQELTDEAAEQEVWKHPEKKEVTLDNLIEAQKELEKTNIAQNSSKKEQALKNDEKKAEEVAGEDKALLAAGIAEEKGRGKTVSAERRVEEKEQSKTVSAERRVEEKEQSRELSAEKGIEEKERSREIPAEKGAEEKGQSRELPEEKGAEEKGQSRELLVARRQLEEVRLKMTVAANVKLLRSGFQIDTAPMEQLIEKLKEMEETFTAQGVSKAAEAVEKLNELRTMPAYTLGFVVSREISFTIEALHEKGSELQAEFEGVSEQAKLDAARERYETMQTAPRADMGDSIRKAFRNVDDILADMNKEPSEENRRAVRMLGYNRIELTQENLERALEVDKKVQNLFEDMKPGKVLQMIREGIDVLHTDIEELDAYLITQKSEFVEESEDFARFLHKLDKNGGITAKERESYIGIYRLIRQVEKSDGKAQGYLLGSEARLTMENLLAAVRSSKKGYMDYKIDENFSGVDALQKGKNIIEQIGAAPYENTTGYEETMQALEGAPKNAVSKENKAADFLKEMHQPVTVSNLLEASAVLQEDASLYQKIEDYEKERKQEEAWEAEQNRLEGYVLGLQDTITDEASLQDGMELFAKRAEELLREAQEQEGITELDVRDMQRLYKGIHFRTALSKESHYQIPVKLKAGYTMMNLTVRKGVGTAQAEISIETEKYGRLEAVFTENEMRAAGEEGAENGKVGVSGSLFAETESGMELLQSIAGNVREGLQKTGVSIEDIAVMRGSRMKRSVVKFVGNSMETKTGSAQKIEEKEISTKELYQIAKIFLETIRQ